MLTELRIFILLSRCSIPSLTIAFTLLSLKIVQSIPSYYSSGFSIHDFSQRSEADRAFGGEDRAALELGRGLGSSDERHGFARVPNQSTSSLRRRPRTLLQWNQWNRARPSWLVIADVRV